MSGDFYTFQPCSIIDIPIQNPYNKITYLGNILINSIDYPHMSKIKYGG